MKRVGASFAGSRCHSVGMQSVTCTMQSGSLVICPIEVQEPEIVIGLLGVNISAYDRLCVILQSNYLLLHLSQMPSGS